MNRWRCALTGHRQTLHPYPHDPAWSRCECNRVTTPRAPHIDAISPAWQAVEEKTIEQIYRCGSCRYFARPDALMPPANVECRRFPRWEMVEESHSCGEWELAG